MGSTFPPEIRLIIGKVAANILRTVQVLIDLPLQRIISVGYFPSAYYPVTVLLEVPL